MEKNTHVKNVHPLGLCMYAFQKDWEEEALSDKFVSEVSIFFFFSAWVDRNEINSWSMQGVEPGLSPATFLCLWGKVYEGSCGKNLKKDNPLSYSVPPLLHTVKHQKTYFSLPICCTRYAVVFLPICNRTTATVLWIAVHMKKQYKRNLKKKKKGKWWNFFSIKTFVSLHRIFER